MEVGVVQVGDKQPGGRLRAPQRDRRAIEQAEIHVWTMSETPLAVPAVLGGWLVRVSWAAGDIGGQRVGLGHYSHSLRSLYRSLGHINTHAIVGMVGEAGGVHKTITYQDQLSFFVPCFFTTPSTPPCPVAVCEYKLCTIG